MRAFSAIAADMLITGSGVLADPLLLLEDGTVTRITSRHETPTPDGALELPGRTLSPGFLDVHVHGAGGSDVMQGTTEAMATVGRTLARYGTTAFLATTVTAPVDLTLKALDGMARVIEHGPETASAVPVGIHLEGPFLSHVKRGVHPAAQLQPASIPLFDRFWEASRGTIRLMTLAPELPGAPELIAHARALGIRVSLGHSNATSAEARLGIAAGATSATHTFNAMRALDHREPGILGVVLDDEALYAELICDGVHTAPELVRLWLRCKGPERAMLVTDGMAATGMPDGRYHLGNLEVDVAGGTCNSGGVLAGSVLTMAGAVGNVQRLTGASLVTAVRLASRNPAQMLGAAALGDVFPGSPANLNIFDEKGQHAGTVLRGRLLA